MCTEKNTTHTAAWKPLIKAQILKKHTFKISKIENFWLYISENSLWKTNSIWIVGILLYSKKKKHSKNNWGFVIISPSSMII